MREFAVIGSLALKQRADLISLPKDIDLIGSFKDIQWLAKSLNTIRCYPIANGKKFVIKTDDGLIIENEIAWDKSTSKELFGIIKNHEGTESSVTKFFEHLDEPITLHFPSIDILYMIKRTHRFLKNSPHFLKTMNDIKFMEDAGAKILMDYCGFFNHKERETYDYSHPKLNVKKMDFFDGDSVPYEFDHDSIHEAVKHYSVPCYKMFAKDGHDVFSDRMKFWKLEEQYRLYAVLEESYVLALERSQIPSKFTMDRKKSFDIALEKVCTSITSGWFREYAYDTYFTVQELYSDTYVDKFKKALNEGKILSYKQPERTV